MISEALLICILSSTLASTLVVSLKELIIWRLDRKAKVEDDEKVFDYSQLESILKEHTECIERILDVVDKMQAKITASVENEKVVLKDKIRYLVFKYVEYGEITLDEKQAIHHMWNIYHYDLGANGDLDDIMELLETVPLVRAHTTIIK